jgi:RHS repeat-associated protein
VANIYVGKTTARLILNFFNSVKQPEQIIDTIVDDPDSGASWAGIRTDAANAVLLYRAELPGRRFVHLDQLRHVKGVGPQTHHNTLYTFAKTLSAEKKALLFANTETDAAKFAKLIRIKSESTEAEIPSLEIRETVAKKIISLRSDLPGKAFGSLDELRERVPDLAQEVIRDLVFTFEEEEKLSAKKAALRARLSSALRPLLTGKGESSALLGADPVEASLDRASELFGDEYRVMVEHHLEAALEAEAVRPGERVAEVVLFAQVAKVKLGAPQGLLDPASIPEAPAHMRWSTAKGSVLVQPEDDATLEWLSDDGWSPPLPIHKPVWIEPQTRGVQVRKSYDDALKIPGAKGLILETSVKAVRITCKGGLGGRFESRPESIQPHLKIDKSKPSTPPCWDFPSPEIWVNPVPTLPPWCGHTEPHGSPGKTGVILVGGSWDEAHPGEPTEKPGEVIVGWDPGTLVPGPFGGEFGGFGGAGGDGNGDSDSDGPGAGFGRIDGGIIIIRDPCSVIITGCPCLRRGELGEYTAEGVPDGGSYLWEVDDDDIAEIVGPNDQKTVKLKGKDIGDVTLTVEYTKDGCIAEAETGIEVIYQRFTLKDNPQSEIMAVPLIQPSPEVRIDAGSVSHQLEEILIDQERAKFHFNLKGSLKDALIDITGVEVSAGRHFKQSLSSSRNEFGVYSDDDFEALKVTIFGPGRSYIRVKARNNIGFQGTDTLDVVIRIPSHWQELISSISATLAKDRERNADPAIIQSQEDRLRGAWQSALDQVQIEFGTLTHTDNTVQKAPGKEKWSIAVEDDVSMGVANVSTSKESQTVVLEEKSENLLAPKDDPKNYFVIHQDYATDRLTWQEDGKMLGEGGSPAALVYFDPCCGVEVPIVGVMVDPLPGVQWIERDESITLSAVGLPERYFNIAGIYTWKVAAHPEGADFRFEPDGPTQSQSVKFFTDIPGIYTFRVDYELAGASSPWTYALADAQILFKIDTAITLQRLGNYVADLAQHLDRPYYRERTHTPQPGAEILVRSASGGPLGQNLDVQVFCPPELVLDTKIRARAFYDDGHHRDYALIIDDQFAFRASGEIRSARVIQRLMIIGIQYGNLSSLKGDAVWIDVRVRPLEPAVADLAGGPVTPPTADATDPASSLIAVVDDDPIGVTPPADGDESLPIINLILRSRDLGQATATQSVMGTSLPFCGVTLVNGNHYLGLPLFQLNGAGNSVDMSLHYNSLAATRVKAVAEYGKLNGKNKQQLQKEFGHELMGPGWSVSVDLALFEFVDTEGGLENSVLHRCVELREVDGNRIVFEETDSPGLYHVRSEAEARGAHPDAALAYELVQETDGWRLRAANNTVYVFDKEGHLKEWSDMRTFAPGRALPPAVLEWSDDEVRILDSAQRVTTLHMREGVIDRIETPETHAWSITHNFDGEVALITNPLAAWWDLEYRPEGLMKRIQPPEGHALEFTHYLGGEVEQVPEDIARDFWGRVARLNFGERRSSIRYEKRENTQQVVTIDPEGHRKQFIYDSTRQAVNQINYAHRDQPDQWVHYHHFKYRGDSKAPEEILDHTLARFTFGYQPYRAKGQVVIRETYPDGNSTNYVYNNGYLQRSEDALVNPVRFEYDFDGQINKITYSPLTTLAEGLQNVTLNPERTFEYDSFGRPTRSTSLEGFVTEYGYDDPQGDSFATGLATSVTLKAKLIPVDGGAPTVEDRTWKYGWDLMGRRLRIENPRGHIQSTEYDELGRIHTVTDGGNSHTYSYDLMDRVHTITDSAGRTASLELNAYGEMKSRTNMDGNQVVVNDRDKNGNIAVITLENGAEYRYEEFDALNRYQRMVYPDLAQRRRRGLDTFPVPDWEIQYDDVPKPFLPAGGILTTRTTYTQRNRVQVHHIDGRGNDVAEEIHQDGRVLTTVRHFDAVGNLWKVDLYEDGRFQETLSHMRRDSLGRVYELTENGTTIRLGSGWDENGTFRVEAYPRQARQPGTPWYATRYDVLGNLVSVTDANGVDVLRQTYEDHGGTIKIYAPDPSSDQANPGLQHVSTLTTDPQGLTTGTKNELTHASVSYQMDALGRAAVTTRPQENITNTFDTLDRLTSSSFNIPEAAVDLNVNGRHPATPSAANAPVELQFSYNRAGQPEYTGTTKAGELVMYDPLGQPVAIERGGLGTGAGLREELFYDRHGELRGRWFGGAYGRNDPRNGGSGPSSGPEVEHGFWALRKDPRNRTIEEVRTMGTHVTEKTMVFDALGRLKEMSNSDNPIRFALEYDGHGRLTGQRMYKNQRQISRVTYHHESDGTLPDAITIRTRGPERRVAFSFDVNLRVSMIHASEFGGDYTFVRNGAGMPQELQRPEARAKTRYQFNRDGMVQSVENSLGDDWEDTWISRVPDGETDAMGNPLTMVDEFTQDNDMELRVETKHEFDSANRLTRTTIVSQSDDSDKEVSYDRQYFYDRHSRKTLEYIRSRSEKGDEDTERFEIVAYHYGSGHALERQEHRIYQPAASSSDRLIKVYAYDAFGRRSGIVETLRKATGGVWARQHRYLYDADNRPSIVGMVERWGTNSVQVLESRYAYDPAGRLVHSDVRGFRDAHFGENGFTATLNFDYARPDDFANAPYGTQHGRTISEKFFVYAGGSLVAILDENGHPLEEYLNGPGINNRLAMRYRPKHDEDWTHLNYHLGRRGNSVFLTADDGDVTRDFMLTDARGGNTNSSRYVSGGMWTDPSSGMAQAGQRAFDPIAGQFTSPDSLGLGGGPNLYGFANQNPVNFTDPGGQSPIHVMIAIGVGIWFLSEAVGRGGAMATGDPSWEISPTQQIYHAVTGHSYYGGLGSTHDQIRYQGWNRAGEGAQGVAGILGAVVPIFGASRGIAAYNLYRAAILAEVAANLTGGAIYASQGHYGLGAFQAVLGLAGLGALRAARAANPAGLLSVDSPPGGAAAGTVSGRGIPIGFTSAEEYAAVQQRLQQMEQLAGPQAVKGMQGGSFGGLRKARESIDDFRAQFGKNHAGSATFVPEGGTPKIFMATSAFDYNPPGFVPRPSWADTSLKWLSVGIGRWTDSEFRILENLMRNMTPGSKGTLLIATELFPCKSCWGAILEFQEKTGIEVSLIYKTVKQNSRGKYPKLGYIYETL